MSTHVVLLFGMVLGLLLTVGVAYDANGRGRSPILWGLVTFFTGLIGAFIYALVVLTGDGSGSSSGASDVVRACPDCGARHEGAPNFCRDCGAELDETDDRPVAGVLRSGSQGYCDNCKSRVALDADRCEDCGAVF